MSLSELSIRRPVLATVLSLTIVLFGLVGFAFLGVREYPAVDPPVISVRANYPGAHPEVVASQITEPLEQRINGIAGIRSVSSTSSEERSSIQVEFEIGVDLEAAANDVRDKVSQAIRELPPDADPPTVEKADADAQPILFLFAYSPRRSIVEVSDWADRVIQERLQTISGVATVRIFGEKRYAMRLWLDPLRLAAHGLTPLDVQAALLRENVDLPSGRIEGSTIELALRTAGRLESEADFDSMILQTAGGRQIELRDVGRAELGAEDLRTGSKSDLLPVIGLALIPQPNTDAIAIADEFYRRLEGIRAALPDDLTVDVSYDMTSFVRRSIREVEETLVVAFALVALIIFAFLRDWRSTLVPVIAIPVSIVSAFFVMYATGFTINVLTLVGIVLAIGLVCDDAIVVLENVYTKVEAGMAPLEAALSGSREIYFAVISTTIALAVVFVPVIFMQGLTGRLFREFGAVVVGSVLVSAFVALTLSPMMCRFMLRRHATHGGLHAATEPFFAALAEGYGRTLGRFVAVRRVVFPLLALLAVVIAVLLGFLPQELAPLEDRSNVRLNIRGPEGASSEFMQHQLDRIAVYLRDHVPETHRALSFVGVGGQGVNNSLFNLYLRDPDERERSQDEVFQQLSGELERFTAVRITPTQPPTIGDRRSGQPVRYVLQAATLEELNELLPEFMREARQSPVLRFVDVDLEFDRPEGALAIDRQRAAELGVSMRDVARTLQLAYGGVRFGYFLQRGRQYSVIGQVDRPDRNDPADLEKLRLRTAGGQMVPLTDLVRFDEAAGLGAIYRYDRFTSATVSAGLAPGHAIGDGIEALDEIAGRVLPPGVRTSLAGQARDFADSSSSLLFAFALALVTIYLVLAAQFESFVDPLIILVTVPMSVAGALVSLALFGQSLNVFSQIGMIMLIGLVAKNGILIVEFANQRRAAGLGKLDAVVDAARARMRPILMTSLATIFGILPIALSLGSASGSRQSLGVAVVGGMLLSTGLTLYVVPAVYALLSRERAEERSPAPAPVGTDPRTV